MATVQEGDARLVGYRPAVSGQRWAVSSGHSLASLAAQRVLDRGGNAIDVGVAAGICTNVVQSEMTCFAGVAAIIIYLAKERKVVTISGVGTWPKAASIQYFQEHQAGKLPLGVFRSVVPAAPDAWLTALERFGTMGVADVMADAITLARDGFPMHRFMHNTLADQRAIIEQWPSTRAIYFLNGRLPEPGEIFVQRNLATTLQTLVDAANRTSCRGRKAAIRAARDCFYTGEIGQRIVQFCKQEGGFLTAEDIAGFHVDVEVITPPTTADILESITRVTLMQLFREEMGITVKEQEIDRTQVYVADEAFFCGSGFEVTPILSVDRSSVGNGEPGPITQEILRHYMQVVRGTTDKDAEWRTPMYQKTLVSA